MTGKINLVKEKRERNEIYALKHKKEPSDQETEFQRDQKRNGGLYGNWCRVKGHPPSCRVMTCKQR